VFLNLKDPISKILEKPLGQRTTFLNIKITTKISFFIYVKLKVCLELNFRVTASDTVLNISKKFL
jgi:hypothetical protein